MREKLQVDLLESYGELTKENDSLKSIHSKFAYYLADDMKVSVKCTAPIYYYDIQSAFPSILNMILDPAVYSDFINTFNSIENKTKKLIYISTNADKIRLGLLRELNSWAKIVIFTKVYNEYQNIQVLEYKKDGILFKGTMRLSPRYDFIDAILDRVFRFHVENDCLHYFRFDKTSIYIGSNGDVEVKGKYKAMPTFVKDSIIPNLPLIVDDFKIQETIKNIYSPAYYLTLVKFGMHKEIINYYGFGNKFMSMYKTSMDYSHSIHSPTAILFKLIYPIITLFKSQ